MRIRSLRWGVAGWLLAAGAAALAAPRAGLPAARAVGPEPELAAALALVDLEALRLAADDLAAADPEGCGKQRAEWRRQLDGQEKALADLRAGVAAGREDALRRARELVALKQRMLLSNPALRSFEKLLLIRRKITHGNLGLPCNWESDSSLPKNGWDNEIAAMSIRDPAAPLETVFKPEGGRFLGGVKLHYAADRVLFDTPGANGRWQVCEMRLADRKPAELPLIPDADVDNYDACYLPDGDVLFTSTAPFTGVPCVRGSSHVANLYRLYRATGKIRRLTFDQEHNWGPVVLDSGRVLYLRWEYADLPHFVARILFQMNPDGTDQGEVYGSNSYWPNSIFYAQPIPGHATKFVGIVTGHHGVQRAGELVVFDPALGRTEADGVVQRIPGRGKKVEPVIRDQLTDGSWPKFLHPCPLNEKYFLVSAKPTPQSNWGIYLADVFDNLLLLKEEPGTVLFEPIALRARPCPPVIPPRIQEDEATATLYVANVYAGPGLKGVPPGAVKRLRLVSYDFAFQNMGGQVDRVGLDGPWDIKRIVGTVPVEADGSALFRVPANVPLSLQPLDADGRALALMRSWTTAMPGEIQSCAGCHERQSSVPPSHGTRAAAKAPAEIAPWYGPARGFSFLREVQPVLDRYCTGCHSPTSAAAVAQAAAGRALPDFTVRAPIPVEVSEPYRSGSLFPPSYLALRRYVRTPTIESDMHLLPPCEFHASTSELVTMLEQGHHGVAIDAEAWDRLNTWIDLNAPAHGTWHELVGEKRMGGQQERRRSLLAKYGGRTDDEEAVFPATYATNAPVPPPAPRPRPAMAPVAAAGWPFDAAEAARRQQACGEVRRTLDLGRGVQLELVRIPAGEGVSGRDDGGPDEAPRAAVKIAKAFWMGRVEVSNEQFAQFDPGHDSRLEHGDFLQFSVQERGYPLNASNQPVCRVSWEQARAFCAWLTAKGGARFDLPDEAQWEYACRAGSAGPFWYGTEAADFKAHANLADFNLWRMDTLGWSLPSGAVPPWRPAATNVNDGFRVAAPVGSFQPNPWGLCDLHGNVWEWTRSDYAPPGMAQAADAAGPRKTVRGGSWYTRPQHATAAARRGYRPWQVVFDVGFRVVCED